MSRRAWVLFALLSIVWGLPYLLIKVAVSEIPVPVLVFGRVALAALILWPAAFRERAWRALYSHRKPLVVFAVLEFAVPWGLLSHAEKSLSSSTAGLLMASIPIITVFLSRVSGDREHLGPLRLSGLVLGLLGVFLLAAPTLAGDGWAIFQVLLAAVCYAIAGIVTGRRLKGVPAFSMAATCLTLASVIYLTPAVLAWPRALPSLAALGSLAGLAIFCTALAFVWFFHLIREAGVSRTTLVTYVNPAIAGLAGVVVLGEPVAAGSVIAFVLILAGSLMSVAGNAKGAAKQPRQDTMDGNTSSEPSHQVRPCCPACPACPTHAERRSSNRSSSSLESLQLSPERKP